MDANGHTNVITKGKPISMGDFVVNAEDCGITTTNTIDSEMQALTRYIAMETVYS
jgi:hypothetical protein